MTTMELFAKALAKQTPADWARKLNVTPEAFYMAKRKQRLSPVMAGSLAIELGEDATKWVAIAALEAEKESPLLHKVERAVNGWRKR